MRSVQFGGWPRRRRRLVRQVLSRIAYSAILLELDALQTLAIKRYTLDLPQSTRPWRQLWLQIP
jgi:hypothetical protein